MKDKMMRRLILVTLLAATALPSSAQNAAASNARSYGTALVIPAAASKPGAFHTFFRTDVSITNHSSETVRVSVGLYPAGVFYYGDPYLDSILTLPPGTTAFENILENNFRWSGFLGAIVLNNPLWNYDPNLKLSATYRIWTPRPGKSGIMSQSSTAIDLLALPPGTDSRVAIGVRHDADFRCNVGIFSDSYYGGTYRVTASSEAGSVSMIVKATGFTVTQVPLPPANLGYVSVTFEPLDLQPGDRWTAYATSVDNRSGDSWIQNASPR